MPGRQVINIVKYCLRSERTKTRGKKKKTHIVFGQKKVPVVLMRHFHRIEGRGVSG